MKRHVTVWVVRLAWLLGLLIHPVTATVERSGKALDRCAAAWYRRVTDETRGNTKMSQSLRQNRSDTRLGQIGTAHETGRHKVWYEPSAIRGTRIRPGGMGESIQRLVQKIEDLNQSRIREGQENDQDQS